MKNTFMPLITIAAGLCLNAVGVIAFMLSDGAITALIPAFCGGFFLIFGGMAVFNAKLRPHAIHGALVLALILGSVCLYFMIGELADDKSALKMFSFQTTATICITYLIMGIRSFRRARLARQKEAAETEAEGTPAIEGD